MYSHQKLDFWHEKTLSKRFQDFIGHRAIIMLGKTEGERRRGRQRMRWLDGITASADMNLGKLRGRVRGREAWCAEFMGPQRVRHNLVTEQQQSRCQARHPASFQFLNRSQTLNVVW